MLAFEIESPRSMVLNCVSDLLAGVGPQKADLRFALNLAPGSRLRVTVELRRRSLIELAYEPFLLVMSYAVWGREIDSLM